MRRKYSSATLLALASLVASAAAQPALADTFGSGVNEFEIEFVRIDRPGNPADTSGQPNTAGAVPYEYRMGKYEVSEQMIQKANAQGGLGITIDNRGPDKPATSVDWFEAAKFVNWLNTSAGYSPAYRFVPIGQPGSGDTQFALWEVGDPGFNPTNRFRNDLAHYFLPSADEWYKSAYYDPVSGSYFDYPTGSNLPPTAVASGVGPGTAVYDQDISAGPADVTQAGGLSPFGSMAHGGNDHEWEETELDLINDTTFDLRGRRGAAWGAIFVSMASNNRFSSGPSDSGNAIGFRVASVVPEPSALALAAFASLIVLGRDKARR